MTAIKIDKYVKNDNSRIDVCPLYGHSCELSDIRSDVRVAALHIFSLCLLFIIIQLFIQHTPIFHIMIMSDTHSVLPLFLGVHDTKLSSASHMVENGWVMTVYMSVHYSPRSFLSLRS